MLYEDFFKVFPGLSRAYGQFFITERKGPKLDGYGKTIRESYTAQLLKEHLDGKTGLGVIPINENNQCKWGCLDVDDYSVDIEKISKLTTIWVLAGYALIIIRYPSMWGITTPTSFACS